jgi:hypothetical protein
VKPCGPQCLKRTDTGNPSLVESAGQGFLANPEKEIAGPVAKETASETIAMDSLLLSAAVLVITKMANGTRCYSVFPPILSSRLVWRRSRYEYSLPWCAYCANPPLCTENVLNAGGNDVLPVDRVNACHLDASRYLLGLQCLRLVISTLCFTMSQSASSCVFPYLPIHHCSNNTYPYR